MMRYTFEKEEIALSIEKAVESVLAEGKRTQDIAKENETILGTREMGREVLLTIESN